MSANNGSLLRLWSIWQDNDTFIVTVEIGGQDGKHLRCIDDHLIAFADDDKCLSFQLIRARDCGDSGLLVELRYR
jgi:hypothetical protein